MHPVTWVERNGRHSFAANNLNTPYQLKHRNLLVSNNTLSKSLMSTLVIELWNVCYIFSMLCFIDHINAEERGSTYCVSMSIVVHILINCRDLGETTMK